MSFTEAPRKSLQLRRLSRRAGTALGMTGAADGGFGMTRGLDGASPSKGRQTDTTPIDSTGTRGRCGMGNGKKLPILPKWMIYVCELCVLSGKEV